jgi:uncharacterized membrane protein (DUF485 family)
MGSLGEEVEKSYEYQEMLKRRRALIAPLSFLTLGIYYAFILALAFFPEALSVRIGEGVTTIGIWLGLGVIFATFAITAIYVHQANKKVEGLLTGIQSRFREGGK